MIWNAAAKPYIPALERAAGLETDDVTKKNIKDAVAEIQVAK